MTTKLSISLHLNTSYLVDVNLCDKISNYCPCQRIKGGCFLDGWALIQGGRLSNNPFSSVGAYTKGVHLQEGAYFRVTLNRGIALWIKPFSIRNRPETAFFLNFYPLKFVFYKLDSVTFIPLPMSIIIQKVEKLVLFF